MILVVMLIMCCCVCSSSITTTTIILFLFFYFIVLLYYCINNDSIFISLRISYEEDDSITAAASPTWNMGKEHYGTNNSLICNKNCI